MAENGDTYDFFKISYELSNGNFLYESKRLNKLFEIIKFGCFIEYNFIISE